MYEDILGEPGEDILGEPGDSFVRALDMLRAIQGIVFQATGNIYAGDALVHQVDMLRVLAEGDMKL